MRRDKSKRMEKRPPVSPREAWEEESSSQESSSPQPFPFYDTTTMQPLQLDASWLPIYEVSEDAVDFIVAFVSSLDKDTHKFTFLKSTYVLCKTALKRGLTQGLDLFCQTCEVVENITDLLEKEPRDRLSSQIRYLAMITINELCLVENVLEGKTKSLLSACFSSVLLLPSEREMPYQGISLYTKTLKAMDTMLRTVVLSFPASRVSKELQDIFELLLDFTSSEREVVQERAVGRIGVLTNLLSNYSALKALGKYLHFSERTDVILEAIKAMRDDSILDKEVPSSMLDAVMDDPDFWLTDVPKIVNCILQNLPCITTESGCRKVESLFLLMTDEYSSAVVIGLCETALQGDSTVQELCDTLSFTPTILDKVITEFATLLLNQWCNPPRESTHTFHRAPSLGQIDWEEFGDEPSIWREQEHPDVVTAFLMLEVLVGLSERAEMAKKIEAFLPSLMKILDVGSEDEKLKIVVIFQNILGQLKMSKASSIAVALVGKILPLFDSECSQLRELSLCLLRDLLRSVVRRDERKMRREVQSALIPLLFRVNDRYPGVAKLMKRRTKAEECMQQSLPYLRDSQSSVRLAAVRFIASLLRKCSSGNTNYGSGRIGSSFNVQRILSLSTALGLFELQFLQFALSALFCDHSLNAPQSKSENTYNIGSYLKKEGPSPFHSFPLEEELNELGFGKAAQVLGDGKRHEGFLGHKQLLSVVFANKGEFVRRVAGEIPAALLLSKEKLPPKLELTVHFPRSNLIDEQSNLVALASE
ncbi:hypothetical protein DUI87_31310 [Hirundo rustica rustica]|uniref:Uncharacterized protein n=1 Tax=Hirundo rustica rustica TaxID=333673 RepID=A0A3M0J0A1_HIRRU|nr:hypothetical protein DUI87_31310 [Hirundo rustica rustica]